MFDSQQMLDFFRHMNSQMWDLKYAVDEMRMGVRSVSEVRNELYGIRNDINNLSSSPNSPMTYPCKFYKTERFCVDIYSIKYIFAKEENLHFHTGDKENIVEYPSASEAKAEYKAIMAIMPS